MFKEGQLVHCQVAYADGKAAVQPGVVLQAWEQPNQPNVTKYKVYVHGVVMLLNEDELSARD